MSKALLVLILASARALCGATDVRVRNDSPVIFEDVVVVSKKYGNIAPGGTTGYQKWERAYRYAYVSLTAAGQLQKITPIDYNGEAFLCDGQMTYVLSIRSGRLDIRAEVDSKPLDQWALDKTYG